MLHASGRSPPVAPRHPAGRSMERRPRHVAGAYGARRERDLGAPRSFHPGSLPQMPLPAPDPTVLHPVEGQQRVVFLRPLVRSPAIEIGEYTYYDSDGDPLAFEREAVLYAYGPERLIVGRFCAIAAGVRFLMSSSSRSMRGRSWPARSRISNG